MNAEARAHYDRGLELYAARDFTGAIREFEAGHAIDPRREFLFAEAQAYRLLGDCARAVPLYRQFVETEPSSLQVEATQLALDRCARTEPATPAAPAAREPRRPEPRTADAVAKASIPPGVEPRAWRDPWLLGATAAAVTAATVGVVLLASARAQHDASQNARTHPEFDRLRSSAEHRYAGGLVALIAASWAVLGGAARASMLHGSRTATIEGSPSSGGATLAVKGWF